MDLAPKLFEECTTQFKQSRQVYIPSLCVFDVRERKKHKDRDDAWVKLESLATQNASKLTIASPLPPRTLISTEPSSPGKSCPAFGDCIDVETALEDDDDEDPEVPSDLVRLFYCVGVDG
jgi:hypothetical protein